MKSTFRFLLLALSVFTSTNPLHAQWVKTNLLNRPEKITALAIRGNSMFAGTYGAGVFLSTNNGSSWAQVNNGLLATEIYSLAISGNNVFVGTNAGVFLSTNNGSSWTQLNNGLSTTATFYSFAISGNNLFVGGDAGVFLSTNNGLSWNAVNNGLRGSVNSLAINGNNIFAGTWTAGVFFSANNGSNWNAVNNGLPKQDITFIIQVKPHSLAINGNTIFVCAHYYKDYIYRSTDNGSNWSWGLGNLDYAYDPTFATIGNSIFLGSLDGKVYLSTNNGEGWFLVNDGLPTDDDITSLVISGTNIFAATYKYGVWWRPLSEMITVQTIPDSPNLVAPVNGATGVVGNPILRWNKAARAETYTFLLSVNPDPRINPIKQVTTADTFAVVSGLAGSTRYYWYAWSTNAAGPSQFGSRVWSFTTVASTDVSERDGDVPADFALEQNYPNPFNPSTTIRYALPKTAFVRLSVFNPLGKEVETFVSRTQVAGEYEIHWNPNNLASGVYLCRLQAGEFVETRKMVLMR